MIAVWYDDNASLKPLGPRDFAAELEGLGVAVHRIDRPSETETQLLFTSLDAPAVAALSAAARARTVIVVDGGTHDVAAEEAKREALGLCGFVESAAWFRWRGGVFVAAGLHGRAEIASAASLTSTPEGLQPSDGVLALPELVARFLVSAEQLLGAK